MANLLAKAQVTQEMLKVRTLNSSLIKRIQNNQKYIGKSTPAYGFKKSAKQKSPDLCTKKKSANQKSLDFCQMFVISIP
jgi:hypothetical protein